jgi:phosphatidylserine/phosphatidylglycerophosphate/cardiolipin synthase-like enzyme
VESEHDDGALLQFLVTRPHCENQYRTILMNIERAQERIWIQMYCLTDTGIIDKLIEAGQRGVDIRILLDSNEFALGLRLRGVPNLAFSPKLMNNGIAVRIYHSEPGHQMHQKSMLVDNETVMVGATNFTRQSFRVNTESMFLIKDRTVAETFAKRFQSDWHDNSNTPAPGTVPSYPIYYTLARWVSRYL